MLRNCGPHFPTKTFRQRRFSRFRLHKKGVFKKHPSKWQPGMSDLCLRWSPKPFHLWFKTSEQERGTATESLTPSGHWLGHHVNVSGTGFLVGRRVFFGCFGQWANVGQRNAHNTVKFRCGKALRLFRERRVIRPPQQLLFTNVGSQKFKVYLSENKHTKVAHKKSILAANIFHKLDIWNLWYHKKAFSIKLKWNPSKDKFESHQLILLWTSLYTDNFDSGRAKKSLVEKFIVGTVALLEKIIPSIIRLNWLNFRLSGHISIAEKGNEFVRDFKFSRNLDWANLDSMGPVLVIKKKIGNHAFRSAGAWVGLMVRQSQYFTVFVLIWSYRAASLFPVMVSTVEFARVREANRWWSV